MTEIPSARQEQILGWLRESRTLAIDDLARRLGVSIMTVHRDLDALERAGRAEKVHGGVTLPDAKRASYSDGETCKCCHMALSARTAFVIQAGGESVPACCAHCGLLLLDDPTTSALAKDFLYGRMVDARRAIYLVDSDVTVCCVPSILCFAAADAAARFQRGFNGAIMNMDEALDFLHAGAHQAQHSS